MSKTSNFFKTTAILSTALFTLLGGCLVEEPIDYTTATTSVSDDGAQQGTDVFDSTAPTAVSVLIDNGASSTSNAAVTLDITATDDVAVTHYYASESAATPQAGDSNWQSYQQSTSFTLSGSNSLGVFQRTVYVWFKDTAGNVSESVDASISLGVYDTTAPNAVSVVIDNGTDNTTSSSVTLTLSATDDQAVTNYYASESAVTPQAGDSGWDNYSTSVSYSFDNGTAGTKTVNVWFKDAAGNVSGSVADTIELLNGLVSGVSTRISSQYYHTCAIKTDGTAQCWGNNGNGQSTVPSDLGVVSSINVGQYHSCAIKTDGTVRCWGSDTSGKVSVPNDLGSSIGISIGSKHSCAIKTGGTVQCWGSDTYGQSSVPADLGTVSIISADYSHTCVIKTDGIAQCWGRNSDGRSTVPSDLGVVKSISTGAVHTCALKADNTVQCWGSDADGRVTVPSDLGVVKAVSAGAWHTCAIKLDDTVQCWGSNNFGQITVPSDLGLVSDISAGGGNVCAIKTDRTAQCWGYGAHGQSSVPAELQ